MERHGISDRGGESSSLWVPIQVLEFPLLPITNNEAEQVLQHWVISRRISQGT
ncbi:hypothetical protein [Ectothiorhodospira variabilis]|uniref:hypothetical protein n=1 Tax=Ectothiorhodospira variabilis TaxID=505694 RepID=UPI003B75CC55